VGLELGTDSRRADAGGQHGGGPEEALNSGASSSANGGASHAEEPDLTVPPLPEPSAPPNGGYAAKAFAPAEAAAASVDRGASAQLLEVQRLREEHERQSSPKGAPEHWPEPESEDLRLDVQAEADGDAEHRTAADDEASFYKAKEPALAVDGDDAVGGVHGPDGAGVEDQASPLAPDSMPPPLFDASASIENLRDGPAGRGADGPAEEEEEEVEARGVEGDAADEDSPCPPPPPALARQMSKVDTDLNERVFKPFFVYSRLVMRIPWCCLSMYLLCTIALVAGLWRPVVLEQDLKTFVRADGQALRDSDAYTALGKIRTELHEKYLSGGRRLEGPPDWFFRGIEVLYAPRNGLSALDHRVLSEVRDFENRLRSLPGWQDFCLRRSPADYPQWACDPGESFAAYAWPTQVPPSYEGERFSLKWDRAGTVPLDVHAVFAYMRDIWDTSQDLRGDEWLYFPKFFDRLTYDTIEPELMRSKFSFSVIYGSSDDPSTVRVQNSMKATQEYDKFIQEELHPLLASGSRESRYIDIFYRGSDLEGFEALQAMQQDILWALGSIAFVTAYMAFHVRSVPFTFGAFFCIFFSVPLAYVLVPAAKTTFASLMSLFLITVIDIDIIFVFNDFWTQSERYGSVERRLTWTIVRAGRSCMATSLTTSLSFFANLLSCLQPLREFGLFMGLCVTNVFVLALMLLPPLIVIRYRREQRGRPESQPEDKRPSDTSPGAIKSASSDCDGDEEAAPTTAMVRGRAPKLAEKRPEKEKDHTNTFANILLYRLIDCVSFLPWTIISISVMCVIAFFVGIASGIELDQGVPAIFQADHNQVKGKEMFEEKFIAAADASLIPNPSMEISVCDAMHFNFTSRMTDRTCALNWCEFEHQEASHAGEGSCWQGPTVLHVSNTASENIGFSIATCREVRLRMLVSAQSPDGLRDLLPLLLRDLSFNLTDTVVRSAVRSVGIVQSELYKPLIMEDWESGEVRRGPRLYEVELVTFDGPASGTAKCDVPVACAFDTLRCKTEDFRRIGTYNLTLPASRRLLPRAADDEKQLSPRTPAHSRRLPMVDAEVDYASQTEVMVMFGVRVPTDSPLVGEVKEVWRWDRHFRPDNPWAQRALAALCDEETLPFELWVAEKTCWIEGFRSYQAVTQKRFPSRSFDEDLRAWYASARDLASDNLWLVDGQLKASRFVFRGDFSRNSGADRILEYKAKWDAYIATRNAAAALTANGAWHTSEAWVLAEAQMAIISSTTDTIIMECALGWFGILVFTQDPVLAFIVLFLIIGNLGGLACFMIQVMGWSIGPIEIIFLVVFLGYSITFGLHFAANFSQVRANDPYMLYVERWVRKRKKQLDKRSKERANSPPKSPSHHITMRFRPGPSGRRMQSGSKESLVVLNPGREVRKARTRMAMLRVGSAVFSSTLSTIGSSVFLLFCTLNFFIRLGYVIMAVTILSLASTLIVLPAVLITMGPAADPWYKRLPARAARWLSWRIRSRRVKGTPDADPLLE